MKNHRNLFTVSTRRFSTTLIQAALVSGVVCILGGHATAATKTWNGGGADGNWNTGGNWGGTAPVANSSLLFDGTTNLSTNNNITAGTAFNGITFASTAGSFTLAGNAIALGSGTAGTGNILDSSTNLQSISLGTITLNQSSDFSVVSGGALTISGKINSGSASNVLNLNTSGSGTITLSSSTGNGLIGAVNINGGLVNATTGTATLGAASNANIVTVASGATLGVGITNLTIGALAGAGTVTNNTSGSLTLIIAGSSTSTNTTFSGNITDGGAGKLMTVILAGSGGATGSNVLNLTGSSNTFGGGLSIGNVSGIANVVSFTNSGGIGTGGVTLFKGASLTFQGGTAQTVTNGLSAANAGVITLNANGTTAGSSALTWTGALTPISAGGTVLTLGGTNTDANSFSGVITTPVALSKIGSGTWDLTKANTYAYGTSVTGGTLAVVGSGTATLGGSALSTTKYTAGQANTTVVSGATAAATLDLQSNSTAFVNNITLSGSANGASLINSVAGTTTLGAPAGPLLGLTFTAASGLSLGTTVTIGAPPSGTTATATATLGVTSSTFAITNGGSGYGSTAPTVTISGGGGLGATAVANLTGGVVTSITITNPGTGFTSLPAITFSAPTSGTTATATSSDGQFTLGSVSLATAGTGYTSAPTFTTSTGTVTGGVGIVAGLSLIGTNNNIGGVGNLTINSVVADGSSSGGFTKIGAGTVKLSGANTYTGGTTINAGIVQMGSATALGTSTGAAITFGSGSTGELQLNGFSTTVTDLKSSATVGTPIIESGSATAGTDTLTVSTSNSDTYAGILQDGGTRKFALSKTGTGSLSVSGANTYTGGTSVSGGTMYADNAGGATYSAPTAQPRAIALNNTTTSATGSGTVTVASGGTLAGSGTIAPGAGSGGVVVQSGGNLASGDVQSNASPYTAGQGLSINNAAGLTSALAINAGAELTFALGAGTNTINAYSFSNPNVNSSYLNVAGNTAGEINFATSGAAVKINLVDLTASSTTATLSLRTSNPYLLIQAGSNLDYNLVTTGGYDANGYVLGTSANGGTTVDLSAFAFQVTDLSGTRIDSGTNYAGLQLYLNNGDLMIVPEPGTWALMLGGLALLVVIQRRKGKLG